MAEAAERARKRAAVAVEPQHKYQRIDDVLELTGNPVSLFAVVAEIGADVHSQKGTDFTRTLRIVDESRPTGISATFFAGDTARLPCVKSTGDVISLHEVMIDMYDHRDFFVKFVKKTSSFALFEGKLFGEYIPYQTSLRYHSSGHEKELLTQTRAWFATNPRTGLKDLELQLRSLKSYSTFDLVCKVLHVHENSGTWIFYVWDGTDTPAAEFPPSLDAEAVESSPLHLEVPPLSREILCTMPCVGTVLRIFSNKYVKEISHLKKNIYWARFCNLTCKQEFGIWKGDFQDSSRVRLLSNEDGSVIDRLKMYDSRNANRVHRQTMTSFPESSNVTVLPAVQHERVAYATLMQSLTHNEVTHKFKTLVRVVAALPCQASELRLLSTGKFCLRLTLEDPTARINAYVHKDNGVKFFGGVLTGEALIKKMNKLLGIPEDSREGAPSTRNPPWIWCCLKSYYRDENNPWGSRTYQIYDTEMRG